MDVKGLVRPCVKPLPLVRTPDRFVSEFGFQSMPSFESLQPFASEADLEAGPFGDFVRSRYACFEGGAAFGSCDLSSAHPHRRPAAPLVLLGQQR